MPVSKNRRKGGKKAPRRNAASKPPRPAAPTADIVPDARMSMERLMAEISRKLSADGLVEEV